MQANEQRGAARSAPRSWNQGCFKPDSGAQTDQFLFRQKTLQQKSIYNANDLHNEGSNVAFFDGHAKWMQGVANMLDPMDVFWSAGK